MIPIIFYESNFVQKFVDILKLSIGYGVFRLKMFQLLILGMSIYRNKQYKKPYTNMFQ